MIFVNKKHHNVDSHHISITKIYFKELSSLLEHGSTDSSAKNLVNSSKEACMELYRHTLCLALDLDSTLGYTDLEPLVCNVVIIFKNILETWGYTTKPDDFKKGFVEACMHCIVMSRNVARGE